MGATSRAVQLTCNPGPSCQTLKERLGMSPLPFFVRSHPGNPLAHHVIKVVVPVMLVRQR